MGSCLEKRSRRSIALLSFCRYDDGISVDMQFHSVAKFALLNNRFWESDTARISDLDELNFHCKRSFVIKL
jgi:hypothetical protein